MNEKIEKTLKSLPNKSGVYIMHDDGDTVIYVGKAKNLKNRVSSYFNNSSKNSKVSAMVNHIDWFEYIITPNELDAFALENNLIKKYQPFYNILLKDSKTFPYIKVDLNSPYPTFLTTRKVLKDGAKYFGPYLAGVRAKVLLDFLNKHFNLKTCKSSLEKPLKRECLSYQMGLCPAPCTRKISQEDYQKNVTKALNFLNGNDKDVFSDLETKMQNCAKVENFEKAIEIRQTLSMLKKLSIQSIANLPRSVSRDAICLLSYHDSLAISIVTVQNGRIIAVQTFPVSDFGQSPSEILESFISSYYQSSILPNEIVLSHVLADPEGLNAFLGKNVTYITNPKGLNLKLLKMAEENALEYLEKNITKEKQKYDNTLGALKVLKEKLGLKKLPMRMECYDVSHISGTNKVSSMVVFASGEPKKKDYRKFKIKTVEGNNDFASLQETLRRRLTRLKNQDGESFKEKPDLLVIDGGKGQLSSCVEILKEFDFPDIEIVGLAKKLEEVFLPNNPVSIRLDHSTPALKLLQRIRDEAHRFGIPFHRQTRGKSMLVSDLDNIPGLGPKKKKALLDAFGSVEKIKTATVEQLNSVKGIDLALAHKIYNKFH